jgi:hypothetical protein
MNTAKLLGRSTALSGAVEEITLGTNLSFAGTTLNASGAGGATLDGITAATADQAGIANADWNIRWNWAKTTNSEVAFEIGESAASTNGTSTSGVPNQVITKFSTAAASTASPLSVFSRATHVFSVSPSAPQLLGNNGSVGNPTYSFAGSVNTGMYSGGAGTIYFAAGGTQILWIDGTRFMVPPGSATAPSITEFEAAANSGFFFGSALVGISINLGENARFGAGTFQVSKGTADAVSYAMNFRKARGSVAAPTVITTGDDLATISGYGYVGATNTYQEACRITFDSTGAISDSATGIGGIIRFLTATVGAEPAECCSVQSGSFVTAGYTVATLPAGVTGAIVHVTDQLTAVNAKGVAPTGGGAVVAVQVYNGAAWVGI